VTLKIAGPRAKNGQGLGCDVQLKGKKELSALAIVIIVNLVTYSLFFAFQLHTEIEIRGKILEEGRYEYEILTAKLSEAFFAVRGYGPDTNSDYSETFENVMRAEGRTQAGQISSKDQTQMIVPSYKIVPDAAIVDTKGTLVWATGGANNVIPSFIESSIGGSEADNMNTNTIVKGNSEGGGISAWTNLVARSKIAGGAISSIEKIYTQADDVQSREYVIGIDAFHVTGVQAQDDGYIVLAIPLSSIFYDIDDLLFMQRLQTFSLVAGISIITIIMAFYINRSNKLRRDAIEKNQALEESNQKIALQQQELARANVQLDKANRELCRLDKAKDQFISIASHELKNPIQPILSFAEFGKQGRVDKNKAFDEILTNGRELKKLASDLLDVTKIDSDQLNYQFASFKLSHLLYEVIEGAKQLALPGVTLEVIFENNEDSNLTIDGDRMRLFQVFANLINNSVKFTDKGLIQIMVKRSDQASGYITIELRDTGTGIPEEILPDLFGKFVASTSQHGNRQGTGLGLYIAKSIIEGHDGKIEAKNNQEPDGGACFRVTLPIRRSSKIENSYPPSILQ